MTNRLLIRGILALFATLAVVHSPSAAEDDVADRVQEGLRLHDAEDYEGAIVVYRSILDDHPYHPTATYEMALSMITWKKDLAEVTTMIEKALASDVEQNPGLPSLLGWAYDELGEYEKGESAFRRGLAARPEDPQTHFNLAVNLGLQQRWDEAATAFLKAIELRPHYPSAWFGLGQLYSETGRAPRAFVAYARAVALEPESPRGRATAETLWSLLFANVEQTNEFDATRTTTDVTISIPTSADTSEDEEPDPIAMEALAMSIVSALRFTDEWKNKGDAAFFAEALDTFTTIASESFAGGDAFWRAALPFFDEARRLGHVKAMAYVLRSAGGDAEATNWVASHEKKVTVYNEWVSGLSSGLSDE
jgi:tetratricopeptide (TPR) repeat protein